MLYFFMTFSANLCKWYIERVNEALFLFICLVIHLLVIHLLKKNKYFLNTYIC